MILISGCLVGINCKYNGGNNLKPELLELMNQGKVIPICPEQLGGAPTPRIPCEITGGSGLDVLKGQAKVINELGEDLTELFLKGAEEVLKIALDANVSQAILKERSPSCGVAQIYDGCFTGKTISGIGVTAALLRENGIKLWTEENY
ncbi:MAG: hypothetical protein APF76_02105 [Desulfitibacter sp. BRH_c19]|nr:MAG: hypothetical protein APF76_02105 [Desulfitibacter sp. BRH_c19]